MTKAIPCFILNLDERKDRLELFDRTHQWDGFKYRRIGSDRGENPYYDNKNSHIRALERGRRVRTNYFLIMEDDAKIIDKEKLDKLITNLTELGTNWDVILLGALGCNIEPSQLSQNKSTNIFKVKSFTGTHAYLVNKSSSDRLIMELLASDTLVDWTLSNAINNSGIRCYIALPFIAHLTISYSNLTAKTCNNDSLKSISEITEKKYLTMLGMI